MKAPDDIDLFLRGYSLVMVNVLYWMPDHRNLLNEFSWQTFDLRPRYPRVERFLSHWEREIEARIKEVRICDISGPTGRVRHVRNLFPIQ